MKQFFKMIIASLIGTSASLVLLFFVVVGIFVGLAGTSQNDSWSQSLGAVNDNSVLTIQFEGPIIERLEKRDVFEQVLRYDEPPSIGLFEVSQALRDAAKDDKIKGLFLNFKWVSAGWAHLEALRREITEFKSTGKWVVAYAEYYTEASYILASAADEVILYPRGYFEWNGISSLNSFFKGTLGKLEVQPQIFRAGKYKSAIEPFINDKMSPESREQIQSIILNLWNYASGLAQEKTQKGQEQLDKWANNMSILFAQDAYKGAFVNLLASFEEVEKKLVELSGAKDEPHYVGWKGYYKQKHGDYKTPEGDQVAVVFAEGEIISGRGERGQISSQKLSALLRDIAKEEDVKAVVLRVNSPGGSALASDVIWTSTQFLKDKKPIVASFANVAASGGYYMSAGTNYIFAEQTTITGSIGVFGLRFATESFWNNKIGMTFDGEKTHKLADIESTVRVLKDFELRRLQDSVDHIYNDFLKVVVQGRDQLESIQQAHEVAQGRVWMAKEAKEMGLVDEFGGLDEAVAKAAKLAELKDYEVVAYPRSKSPFEEILMQMGETSMAWAKALVPEPLVQLLDQVRTKKDRTHEIYTRLPFDIEIR